MWPVIEYILTLIGAGIVIIIAFILLIGLVFVVYSFFRPHTKGKCSETCKFYKLNGIEEPCIYCEDGDCYQRSNPDRQDDLN